MKNFIILALISIFLLIACSDNTAPRRYSELSYYLCGILEAGYYVDTDHTILLGKTMGISSLMDTTLSVTDAEIVLMELADSQIRQSVILVWDAAAGGYIDLNEELLIKTGLEYRIEASLSENIQLSGETIVPNQISVFGDSIVSDIPAWSDYPDDGQWPELILEEVNSNHPIQIGTLDNQEFNLLTEFYCLEEYWNAEYTYPPEDNDFPVDNQEYMGDVHQYPRRNLGYYMYQPDNFMVNFNSYQSSLLFYGKTEASVYSIDSNYLKYLYKSDGYTAGGIIGGIGVFGSKCGKKLYTRIIK
ncbi:MAG: hypothetical protein RAO94_03225 [Candidatus Stygibacter australis]|nr:hypothetical protein [Candidatus Stygibacter australis]MDP8321347.1 hypothetical protein [Candidatus Stygibacter australis]